MPPNEWRRHRNSWESLPLDERLRILTVLRVTPQPWGQLALDIEEHRGMSGVHAIRSLIMAVVLFGFDDPFITGAKSLDDPAVLADLRSRHDAREQLRRRVQLAAAVKKPTKRRAVK